MTESSILNSQQAQAAALLELDEGDLEKELQARVYAHRQNPDLSLQPVIEASSAEGVLPAWIEKSVDAMVKSGIQQSYDVLCGTASEDKTLRDQLLSALGLGTNVIVLAFQGFLITTIGLAPALAIVVAAILVKRIGTKAFGAGYDTMCVELGKMLPSAESGTPSASGT